MSALREPRTAWVAACMEPDEWEAWQVSNRRIAVSGRAPRPCSDCPLGFAAEMRSVGRCNGSPNGVDDHEEDEMPDDPQARGAVLLDQGVITPVRDHEDARWDELERTAVDALIDYLSTGDPDKERRASVAQSVIASGQRRRRVELGRDQLHWNMATRLTDDPQKLAEYVRVTRPSPGVVAAAAPFVIDTSARRG